MIEQLSVAGPIILVDEHPAVLAPMADAWIAVDRNYDVLAGSASSSDVALRQAVDHFGHVTDAVDCRNFTAHLGISAIRHSEYVTFRQTCAEAALSA